MSPIINFWEAVAEVIFEYLGNILAYLPKIVFSLYVPAILVLLILLTGVIYSISGIAKFKWWTLLLLFAFAILSFPFRIVLNAHHFESVLPATGYEFTPWIIRAFCFIGLILPLLWIFSLWLIKSQKGVSFKSKRVRKISVYGLICILSIVTLSEEALYPAVGLLVGLSRGGPVASSVSLDRKRKIVVFYIQFRHYYYRLISQKNTFFPILAREIGTVSKRLPSWGFTGVRLKFLWSENSDIVSLWHKGKPVWAYQFSKNRQLDLDSKALNPF